MALLLVEKVVKLFFGIYVGSLVAKYLGAANFGDLNYYLNITSLGIVFSTLGMSEMTFRDISSEKSSFSTIISSVLLARLIAGFSFFLVFSLILVSSKHVDIGFALIELILLTMIFSSYDVLKFYFDSRALTYYCVVIELSTFILASLLKVLVVYFKLSQDYIYCIFFIEVLLNFFILYYLFNYVSNFVWKPNWNYLKNLLKSSFPLFLGSIMTVLYMKFDSILVYKFLGNESAGNYSAAVKIVEIFNTLPVIGLTLFGPKLYSLATKNIVGRDFLNYLRAFYFFCFWLSVTVTMFLIVFGDFIIQVLYKDTFLYAGIILKVYSLSLVSVYLGVVSSAYFISIGKTKLLFWRTFFGLLLSLTINLLFVPNYGSLAAAWSTTLSYFLATFSFVFFPGGLDHLKFIIKSIIHIPSNKSSYDTKN